MHIRSGGGGGLVAKLHLTLVTPWTVAHQPPLSMGFPKQEYWSGLPFPSPRDLPDPGIKPESPALQADSLPPSHQGALNNLWSLQNEGELIQWPKDFNEEVSSLLIN